MMLKRSGGVVALGSDFTCDRTPYWTTELRLVVINPIRNFLQLTECSKHLLLPLSLFIVHFCEFVNLLILFFIFVLNCPVSTNKLSFRILKGASKPTILGRCFLLGFVTRLYRRQVFHSCLHLCKLLLGAFNVLSSLATRGFNRNQGTKGSIKLVLVLFGLFVLLLLFFNGLFQVGFKCLGASVISLFLRHKERMRFLEWLKSFILDSKCLFCSILCSLEFLGCFTTGIKLEPEILEV
mmetsp:Transcript_31631/g.57268  ORF Transcript_31631/g.57268 Transcript_31631/m.57268 type:complete len:238 (-) Transcript_31631:452-1165(-)